MWQRCKVKTKKVTRDVDDIDGHALAPTPPSKKGEKRREREKNIDSVSLHF